MQVAENRKSEGKVMAEPTKLVRTMLEQYGLDVDTSCWDCHGTLVILHKACQIIAQKAGIEFGLPYLVESDPDLGTVVVLVTGTMAQGESRRTEWSFGEASSNNNHNPYPYAMAEKRAKDRVTLFLAGIHGYVYSEVEAEEFRESKPERRSPSPQPDPEPEKEIAAEIDPVAELNTLLLVLGCEDSDHANAICGWAWDNPTTGVEQCRDTPSNAMETLTRLDDKESEGVSREDMLASAVDYIQEHLA